MELTEKQLAYVDWQADPMRPGTKTAWAAEHNVDITTLRAWEKKEWYSDAMADALSERSLGGDSVIEVIHAVQRAAKDGDMRAATTYLNYLERVNPQREAPREARAVEELTDAELDAAWAEARAF